MELLASEPCKGYQSSKARRLSAQCKALGFVLSLILFILAATVENGASICLAISELATIKKVLFNDGKRMEKTVLNS